jgi:hypothetical protein
MFRLAPLCITPNYAFNLLVDAKGTLLPEATISARADQVRERTTSTRDGWQSESQLKLMKNQSIRSK